MYKLNKLCVQPKEESNNIKQYIHYKYIIFRIEKK